MAGPASSSPPPRGGTIVCIHEDRPECLTGVKLAVLGLAKHDRHLRVLVHCPRAPADFEQWLRGQANATAIELAGLSASGWNVKADVLLQLLQSHDEVVWIDSDILPTASISGLLTGMPRDVLLATEETYWGQRQGGTFRTTEWGLQAGRRLAATVNTGLLRVTRAHVALLRSWQAMMAHPAYRKAQEVPWHQRPLHMVGDQEVLTGLLGSTDFAHVPLRLLRRGVDIAQCLGPAGFTPMERLRALRRGCPPLIHAMGPKPWRRPATPLRAIRSRPTLVQKLRGYYELVALEVSPYTVAARAHAHAMKESTHWMQSRSIPGRLLHVSTGSNVLLAGLPLSLFDHLVRFARSKLGMARFAQVPGYSLTERPF